MFLGDMGSVVVLFDLFLFRFILGLVFVEFGFDGFGGFGGSGSFFVEFKVFFVCCCGEIGLICEV